MSKVKTVFNATVKVVKISIKILPAVLSIIEAFGGGKKK